MAQLLRSEAGKIESKMLAPMRAMEELSGEGQLTKLTSLSHRASELLSIDRLEIPAQDWELERTSDLLSFFHDRLKVYLRDKGARHDLIDAVITPEADDLLLVVSRVAALGIFLDTEDGKNLLAGTKRAANILAAEEKKGTRVAEAVDPALLSEDAEKALFSAVNHAESEASQAVALQDFEGAMRALATLRAPVDAFFDAVMVNVDDEAVRANRLALLARIRAATGQVADFSKIAG